MEGRSQIASNAGKEQLSVGKKQIKGVTVVASHVSLPPGTCHTEFFVKNGYA